MVVFMISSTMLASNVPLLRRIAILIHVMIGSLYQLVKMSIQYFSLYFSIKY